MPSPRDTDDAEQPKAKITGPGHAAESEPDRSTTDRKKDISPLVLTILGAIGTGLFAIANSFLQARQAHQLEQDKLQSTIILKAIEPTDPDERKKALLFYVEVGLLADPNGKIAKLKPEDIPQAEGQFIKRIGYSDILKLGEAIVFSAGMMIDPDGAPRAYHPDNRSGLDYLANAGSPGNWYALITDNGTHSGTPVIQGPKDPAPGYYVSYTSLVDSSKDRTDPLRYVDSSTVPYVVIPTRFSAESGVKLGDIAAVHCAQTEKLAFAVVADLGPAKKIGEGSIALAAALGLNSDPKKPGVDNGITYVVFPQSGERWPMSLEEIRAQGAKLFAKWGGIKRMKAANIPPPASAAQRPASSIPTKPTASLSPTPIAPKNKIESSKNIESRVRDLIVEELGVNPDQVVPTANLVKDLGADELDRVDLIMAIEKEFSIEVPDEDAEPMKTVADVVTYVRAHVKSE